MRLFAFVSHFTARIANAKVTLDGEGMMAYMLVAAVAAPCGLVLWFYGNSLADGGQTAEGVGLIFVALAIGICLIAVPFLGEASPESEALRLENELRDELEASIYRLDGLFSRAQGMRLAGLVITAGKMRAAARGIPLRVAVSDVFNDLTIFADSDTMLAWCNIGLFDTRGFRYKDSPPESLSTQHKPMVVFDYEQSTWTLM